MDPRLVFSGDGPVVKALNSPYVQTGWGMSGSPEPSDGLRPPPGPSPRHLCHLAIKGLKPAQPRGEGAQPGAKISAVPIDCACGTHFSALSEVDIFSYFFQIFFKETKQQGIWKLPVDPSPSHLHHNEFVAFHSLACGCIFALEICIRQQNIVLFCITSSFI